MNRSKFLILNLLLFSSVVLAQTNGNKGITFQGVIKDNSNPSSPAFPTVTSNVVVQILGVRSDGNSCILWEEMHSGVQIEKGYLYLVVGRGNKSALPTLSFKDVFNDKPKTSLTCSNGFTDYTPLATDSRKLRVVVSSLGITADFNMRSAPLAVHSETAASAEALNGKASADFINVNTPGGLTQAAAESWFGSTMMADILAGTYAAPTATTAGNVTGVVAVANGGTGASTAAGARTNLGLGPLAVMNPTGTADATTYLRGDGTWAGLPSAPTLAGDVSGAVGANTVDKIKGTAVNTTAMADGHFLRFESGAWINGALVAADVPALDWAKITTGKPTNLTGYGITDAVNKSGDTMAGALNMGSNDVTATGYVLMSPQRALGLGTYTNAQEATLTGGLSAAHKGYTWYNSEANQVKFWNGTTVQALGVAGSGITSIGGQTGGAQAFATGTVGTSPAWSSGSDTHTLHIPMAATGSVTAGLLSNADYVNFSGKLGPATTFGGDVTGTYNAISLNTVPVSKGGTGQTTAAAAFDALSPLTTKGDVLVHDGTVNLRMAVGSDGKALIADSAEAAGVKWGDIFATDLLSMVSTGIVQRNGAGSYSAVTVNGPLTYSSGALGVNVGTGAGSVAAGDDARITGALQRSGGTMTGALGLGTYSNAQESTLVGTLNATHKGYAWFNSDANQVKIWNGSAAQALGIAGSGITSFGGQSGNSQSLAIGTSGNSPAWSSASDTHTLNIPMASAAGVTAGLLNKTDYDAFAAKQPAGNYVTALTGDVTATGPGSVAATIAADAVTSAKIANGTIVSADMDFTGVNTATTSFAMKDSTGKFYSFACATTGHVPTWTAAGFVCQAPTPLLPALADGKVWIGDGANAAAAQTLSGDATVSNAGVVTVTNVRADRVSSAAGQYLSYKPNNVSCANNEVLKWNGTGWICGVDNAGTGTVTGVTASAPLASSGGTAPVISIASGTTAGQTLRWNSTNWVAAQLSNSDITGLGSLAVKNAVDLGTADATGTLAAGRMPALTGDVTSSAGSVATTLANSGVTAGTYSKVSVDAKGRVTVGANIAAGDVTTALGYTPVNKAGDVMTGSLGLGNYTNATETTLITGWGAGDKGKTWFNTTSNQVKYWDGSAAVALGVSGAGLTSLNGQTGSTQTFATPGTSGLAPAWSSAGNAHTLNIPMASTASVTAGLISKTDYDSFAAKQAAGNYVTALTGDVTATGPGSVAATIAANAVTSAKIANGTVVQADMDFTGVNSATTGFSMVDSTGKFYEFACATTGHVPTWTVTGFACQAPGANITSGNVTTALGYTPVNDAGDTMTGDLTFEATKGINFKDSSGPEKVYLKSPTALAASYNLTWPAAVPTAGQSLQSDASGNLSWYTPSAGTGDFKADGTVNMTGTLKAVAGTAALPGYTFVGDTNTGVFAPTADVIGVSTAGVERMRISATGSVGIGTTSPTRSLHVNGATQIGSGTSTVGAGVGGSPLILKDPTYGGFLILESYNSGQALSAGRILSLSNMSGNFELSRCNDVNCSSRGQVFFVSGDQADPSASLSTTLTVSQNGTAASPGLGFSSGGGLMAPGTNAIAIATSGAQRLTVDSAGNVGIGTVTPGSPLQVNGEIRTSGATSGYTGFRAPASGNNISYTLPGADGSANQVLTTNGSGTLSWTTPAAAGITSLGGLTAATQTFAIGTAGTAPAFSSATSTHTLNIPMASTATVTAGLISKTDYDNFNGKFAATVTSPLAGQHIRYNGSAWVNALVALSSDVTGTLSIANGGTGATSAGSARTSLGIGSAGTRDTGAVSGNVPLVGVSGITANKMCTSDGTSSIICNTNIPTSQWGVTGSDIYYNAGKVAIGASGADRNLTVVNNSSGQGAISVQNNSGSGVSSVEFFNNGGGPEGFVGWGNSSASGVSNTVVLGSNGVRPVALFTNNTKVLTAYSSGNVGIGVAGDPDVKLKVNGAIASALVNDLNPTSFDLSLGNYQYTATGCSGTSWDLVNMAEGTTYTIAVQNNTHTGTCSFTNSGSTFRYQPTNATPASGHVLYSFMKVGTVIYVSWIDGFN
ncbi:cell wall anchor protein [Bdellovibrio bacteriovorus]|uniref:cell wall anchor protein n=1 Tax=Bdellovibrio bacteriovorus TaxID=959 RepID=UPI0035A63E8D